MSAADTGKFEFISRDGYQTTILVAYQDDREFQTIRIQGVLTRGV